MCGINGIAFSSRSGRQIDSSVLTRMRDVITHRGPDEEGLFVDGADWSRSSPSEHRRRCRGHQPMTNEDGSLHIIYNGEIYNHADYREQARSARSRLPDSLRHRNNSASCTKSMAQIAFNICAACLLLLSGMETKKQLFIARDRLGVKPLYYFHAEDGSLYFGSEIKTLLAANALKPELNFEALPDYLANHATSGEETLFVGIKRLLPGHTLMWRDGRVEIKRYWDVSFDKE